LVACHQRAAVAYDCFVTLLETQNEKCSIGNNLLQLGENLIGRKLKTRQILSVHLDFGWDNLKEEANLADWGRRTVKGINFVLPPDTIKFISRG